MCQPDHVNSYPYSAVIKTMWIWSLFQAFTLNFRFSTVFLGFPGFSWFCHGFSMVFHDYSMVFHRFPMVLLHANTGLLVSSSPMSQRGRHRWQHSWSTGHLVILDRRGSTIRLRYGHGQQPGERAWPAGFPLVFGWKK